MSDSLAGVTPPEPTYTVAAVANRLGVAPATLRTWDRRYGLGPSNHTEGAHRRYSGTDIARLFVMRQLTLEGVAPADAARIAITTTIDQSDAESIIDSGLASPTVKAPVARQDNLRSSQRVTLEWDGRAAVIAPQDPVASSEDTLIDQLIAAAQTLEHDPIEAVIDEAVRRHGFEMAWTHIIHPAMRRLADDVEPLVLPGADVIVALALAIFAVLRRRSAVHVAAFGDADPEVVLYAADDFTWGLSLHMLAAAFLEHGISARVQAAAMPPRSLTEVIGTSQPALTIVHAVATSPQITVDIEDLRADHPQMHIFLTGGGWDNQVQGEKVHHIRSFSGTLHEAIAVLRD